MSTTGWIILGAIAVVVLWVVGIFNGIVAMGQRVSQAFAAMSSCGSATISFPTWSRP
jgi:hypothetical protein